MSGHEGASRLKSPIHTRKVKMNMFRAIALNLLVIAGLLSASVVHAEAAAIQVYKGELRVSIPDRQARDSLLIRYRSKTREVVRIGISAVALVNTRTNQVTRLQDRSASLSNRYDRQGYWSTDIHYSDLNLGNDDYRIQGRLTLYLIGSQRTRNFSVYLQSAFSNRPEGSSIDWGLSY